VFSLSLSLSEGTTFVKSEKSVLFFHFFCCCVRSFTSDGRTGFGSKNEAVVVLAWKSISTDSILVFGIVFSLQESGDGILWNCVSVESQSGVKGGRELDFGRVGSLKTNSVLQERIWAQFW
jgi:hypothetical protein